MDRAEVISVAAYLGQLERDYEADVAELRVVFAAVDRADPASLRRWFATYPYLAANDLARIAGVCLRTVQRWKKRAGLSGPGRRPPRFRKSGRPVPRPPPDWRAVTWLEDAYAAGHGVRPLARAIGRSYTATRRLLLRRGVTCRSGRAAVRSWHYCCTQRWLTDHYLEQGLSLTRCARLARVSKATMTAWLLSYQIPIRSNGQQQMVNHASAQDPRAWQTRRLEDHPMVRKDC
jgi:hypothetical protein